MANWKANVRGDGKLATWLIAFLIVVSMEERDRRARCFLLVKSMQK